MTKARKHKKRPSQSRRYPNQPSDRTLPFIEHIHELRKRLSYIALSVGLFGALAYAVERNIVNILLRPAHGQQFIYTSPGGGIDFLFRVCLYVGLIASIPVIIYQLLRYIEPLIQKESVHFIAWGSFVSGVLAVIGVLYGYFWGLPAALHFLLHQFVTTQIRPLVTIQSYMSFVMVYMVGSALLFQVPLVLIFINRIKPLKPGRLLHYERHVIVGALLIAAIMNPTPNLLALSLLAGPIVIMYQVGIAIIWYRNRGTQMPATVKRLLEQDAAVREARALQAARSAPIPAAASRAYDRPKVAQSRPAPAQSAPVRRSLPRRQARPINDFQLVRRRPNELLRPQHNAQFSPRTTEGPA